MKRKVRYSPEARTDILRLYAFLLEKDVVAAGQALAAIEQAVMGLALLPFRGRRLEAAVDNIRELVTTFGKAGYLALYHVSDDMVTILAIRHQREDDYR
ncbi:type II toxin-antitoxin system RelE/ParE family toxin [Rhizobium sp. 18065]|uniref:type II toxin-antitoxin system RelE/ParE family toxin n=1 Tax=Rhizobium sp. 18065 TaxID=2681411 RepID=UPI00135B502B|nr:type II toxin-antitoxin system RelE/ParE family toxin [Rhizobium sp. 18065]